MFPARFNTGNFNPNRGGRPRPQGMLPPALGDEVSYPPSKRGNNRGGGGSRRGGAGWFPNRGRRSGGRFNTGNFNPNMERGGRAGVRAGEGGQMGGVRPGEWNHWKPRQDQFVGHPGWRGPKVTGGEIPGKDIRGGAGWFPSRGRRGSAPQGRGGGQRTGLFGAPGGRHVRGGKYFQPRNLQDHGNFDPGSNQFIGGRSKGMFAPGAKVPDRFTMSGAGGRSGGGQRGRMQQRQRDRYGRGGSLGPSVKGRLPGGNRYRSSSSRRPTESQRGKDAARGKRRGGYTATYSSRKPSSRKTSGRKGRRRTWKEQQAYRQRRSRQQAAARKRRSNPAAARAKERSQFRVARGGPRAGMDISRKAPARRSSRSGSAQPQGGRVYRMGKPGTSGWVNTRSNHPQYGNRSSGGRGKRRSNPGYLRPKATNRSSGGRGRSRPMHNPRTSGPNI